MSEPATYVIHIEGVLGPMLVSSLTNEVTSDSCPWDVRTERSSVIVLSVTDDDLVDVVRRLAESGVEIGCVREIGVPNDQAEAPAPGVPSRSRIRYSQNS
ncbi:MAG TPA: hypothetical protein VGH43_16620 [Jatrophihabitans sp.]|jgi:hypothetical protein